MGVPIMVRVSHAPNGRSRKGNKQMVKAEEEEEEEEELFFSIFFS